jgi:hypothetical protein
LYFAFDGNTDYGYILMNDHIVYRGQPSWAGPSNWSPLTPNTPNGVSFFSLDDAGNGYILYTPDNRLKRAAVSSATQSSWFPMTPADRFIYSFSLDGADKTQIRMTYDNILHHGIASTVDERHWSRIKLRWNDTSNDFFPCGVYLPWHHLAGWPSYALQTWPNPNSVLEDRLDDLLIHHVNLL